MENCGIFKLIQDLMYLYFIIVNTYKNLTVSLSLNVCKCSCEAVLKNTFKGLYGLAKEFLFPVYLPSYNMFSETISSDLIHNS